MYNFVLLRAFFSTLDTTDFRLLCSIIKEKSPSRSIPSSILYRLLFETQGRKYGRNLSWSCQNLISVKLLTTSPLPGWLKRIQQSHRCITMIIKHDERKMYGFSVVQKCRLCPSLVS